jgi:hypothetical protein
MTPCQQLSLHARFYVLHHTAPRARPSVDASILGAKSFPLLPPAFILVEVWTSRIRQKYSDSSSRRSIVTPDANARARTRTHAHAHARTRAHAHKHTTHRSWCMAASCGKRRILLGEGGCEGAGVGAQSLTVVPYFLQMSIWERFTFLLHVFDVFTTCL